MPFSSETISIASLVVSGVAVIVAVVFGVVNLRYTKRSFEATNYPVVRPELRCAIYRGNSIEHCLEVSLSNLHSSTSLSDVTIDILVGRTSFWGWRGIGEWVSYASAEFHEVLAPRGNIDPIVTGGSLEAFLVEQYPDLLYQVLNTGEPWGDGQIIEYAGRYEVRDHRPLHVRIVIQYTPGVSAGGGQKTTTHYRLTPIEVFDPILEARVLKDWKVSR